MINNKKIIEKYHKKMETINKIEDEFTKSQNKIKLIIDMMMYEKNNKECKKEAWNKKSSNKFFYRVNYCFFYLLKIV